MRQLTIIFIILITPLCNIFSQASFEEVESFMIEEMKNGTFLLLALLSQTQTVSSILESLEIVRLVVRVIF